jgi:hypothetical protein
MALRDLPEEERAAAREKVSAEMRSKITAMLTTGTAVHEIRGSCRRRPPRPARASSGRCGNTFGGSASRFKIYS